LKSSFEKYQGSIGDVLKVLKGKERKLKRVGDSQELKAARKKE
jgi:hypothetical protein